MPRPSSTTQGRARGRLVRRHARRRARRRHLARRGTSAARWTAPVEVANGVQPDGTRHPCWNPVLFETAPGTLTLFYKVGPSPQTLVGHDAHVARQRQDVERRDGGCPTASSVRSRTSRCGSPTARSSARASTESTEQPSKWRVHFERSTDGGKTWTSRPAAADRHRHRRASSRASSSIRAAGCRRSGARGRGRVFETWSEDGGRSWSRDDARSRCRTRAPAPTPSRSPTAGTSSSTTTRRRAGRR